MFTGLIEAVGEVRRVSVTRGTAGMHLSVATDLTRQLKPGDSVAINGVCLTVVRATDATIDFDVSPETLRVTSLDGLQPGSLVNLERPLQTGAGIGGHFVQGHVDARGTLRHIVDEGGHWLMTIEYPPALAPLLVSKGSIAVDGISLTIARLGDGEFDVQIVPFTREHTNLRAARPPAPVNLECDILGKYVQRFLELAGKPIISP
jgi:riboflavin synthase